MKFDTTLNRLSSEDAVIAFGEGFGDLGASPKIDAPLVNPEANSTVFVSFVKNSGELSTVSGFTTNDLEVTGGQVSGFSEYNATHYRFYVVPTKSLNGLKSAYQLELPRTTVIFLLLLALPGFNISNQ